MKNRFLLLFFFVVAANCSFAQYTCGNLQESSNRNDYNCSRVFTCNNQDENLMISSYIPNESTPVINIPVIIHIYREDDGTGSYWQDSPNFRDSLRQVFIYLNNIYSQCSV